MKTKTVFTISIILSILLFLFHWYLWDIIDLVTPFLILVPIIIILVFVAFVLIYTIVYAAKRNKGVKTKGMYSITDYCSFDNVQFAGSFYKSKSGFILSLILMPVIKSLN